MNSSFFQEKALEVIAYNFATNLSTLKDTDINTQVVLPGALQTITLNI